MFARAISPVAEPSRKSNSARIRDVLGAPPLLAGEDLGAYETLHARVVKALTPTDVIEEIWANDVADLTWEAHRWRRLKVDLVFAAAHEGVNEILTPMLDEVDRTDLVKAWASGDIRSRRRAASALRRAGMSAGAITAMTQLVKIDALEKIDRLIALAERRRNLTLREVDRYRDVASARRRRFRSSIDNLDFIERPSRHAAE
jgi:hypothetical protein